MRVPVPPVVGPGSRPYKRSRDFAQFAEHSCAYLEEPGPGHTPSSTWHVVRGRTMCRPKGPSKNARPIRTVPKSRIKNTHILKTPLISNCSFPPAHPSAPFFPLDHSSLRYSPGSTTPSNLDAICTNVSISPPNLSFSSSQRYPRWKIVNLRARMSIAVWINVVTAPSKHTTKASTNNPTHAQYDTSRRAVAIRTPIRATNMVCVVSQWRMRASFMLS